MRSTADDLPGNRLHLRRQLQRLVTPMPLQTNEAFPACSAQTSLSHQARMESDNLIRKPNHYPLSALLEEPTSIRRLLNTLASSDSGVQLLFSFIRQQTKPEHVFIPAPIIIHWPFSFELPGSDAPCGPFSHSPGRGDLPDHQCKARIA